MQIDGFTFGPTPPPSPLAHARAWDGDGPDFGDLLDIVNPLHHLPVVSSLYRAGTTDEIGGIPRLLGGLLFGGPLGLLAAAVNVVVEAFTGDDIGGHVTAALWRRPDEVVGREERMLTWTPDAAWRPETVTAQRMASDGYRRIAGLRIGPPVLPAAAYELA